MPSPVEKIVRRMTPTERLVALVGVLVLVATLSATALARWMAPPVVIAVDSHRGEVVELFEVNRCEN